ncbi:MAG: squalene/phytoene synthase family protein [Polymorphobacter sp.]
MRFASVRRDSDALGRSRLISDLDIVTAQVRDRDRDRYLSVLYAPAAARPGLFALHALDLELAAVVAGTTDPMIGEIRLAWWREALCGLDDGVVPAQPLLQLLAAAVLPCGVTGADLAVLEDRWLGLIGSDDVPLTHIDGGGVVFALAAQLSGGDAEAGRALGRCWSGGDAPPTRNVPAALRPLLGLVRLAQRDAERARKGLPREVHGSPARQLRLLQAVALGR